MKALKEYIFIKKKLYINKKWLWNAFVLMFIPLFTRLFLDSFDLLILLKEYVHEELFLLLYPKHFLTMYSLFFTANAACKRNNHR